MDIAIALLAGVAIGGVLGFIGSGGAMLSVPILLYLFDFTPLAATTGALAIVLAASMAGALPKARAKEIYFRDALVIWALGLVTNLSTSIIVDKLSNNFITTGFAIILLLAALSMVRKPSDKVHKRMPIPALILISLLIGAITGIFGIGGGFVVVPVLINAFGTPPRIATGTSLVVIALNSVTAFIGHVSHWSEVSWRYPIIIGISAVFFALLASHKQKATNSPLFRNLFVGVLVTVSGFTMLQTWF